MKILLSLAVGIMSLSQVAVAGTASSHFTQEKLCNVFVHQESTRRKDAMADLIKNELMEKNYFIVDRVEDSSLEIKYPTIQCTKTVKNGKCKKAKVVIDVIDHSSDPDITLEAKATNDVWDVKVNPFSKLQISHKQAVKKALDEILPCNNEI